MTATTRTKVSETIEGVRKLLALREHPLVVIVIWSWLEMDDL